MIRMYKSEAPNASIFYFIAHVVPSSNVAAVFTLKDFDGGDDIAAFQEFIKI